MKSIFQKAMTHCSPRRPIAFRHAWVFLLFAALPAVLLPAKALRTKTPAAVLSKHVFSAMTSSDKRIRKNPLAFVALVSRGGAEESAKSTANVQGDKSDSDLEEVEGVVEEETDSEEDGLVEEVVEEMVEVIEAVDASAEEDVTEEKEVVVVEEEGEEGGVVVFSTEEIPSDDVRSFHTTDGELADDEGFYTDGQNESPMADNEAEADAIGTTEEPADSGSDDGDGIQEDDSATEEATVIQTAASATVIDDALKEVLMTELRYTKDDVSRMRPEIAVDVVRNKLMRPTEGMPKNWYIDPIDSSKKQSFLAKKKRLVVSVAAVGFAALVLKEKDTVGDAFEEMVDALQVIPKSLVAAILAAKQRVTPKSKPTTPATPAVAPKSEMKEESTVEEDTEDEPENTDTSVHSIKPGTSPEEVPDPELDSTWLDKMITRIGGLVKSFFNIRI